MNFPNMPPAPMPIPPHVCLSGQLWCSGCNPCEECLMEVRHRVLPTLAQFVGVANEEQWAAFLDAYMAGWEALHEAMRSDPSLAGRLRMHPVPPPAPQPRMPFMPPGYAMHPGMHPASHAGYPPGPHMAPPQAAPTQGYPPAAGSPARPPEPSPPAPPAPADTTHLHASDIAAAVRPVTGPNGVGGGSESAS